MLSDHLEPVKARLLAQNVYKELKKLSKSSKITIKNSNTKDDKLKRLSELQAVINSKIKGAIQNPSVRNDENTDKELVLPKFVPTLQANKRMAKQEEFKSNEKESKLQKKSIDSSLSYVDSSIVEKPFERDYKPIKFIDHESVLKFADEREKKFKLNELNRKIAEAAKKTGIASSARANYYDYKSEDNSKTPQLEWWDVYLLSVPGQKYDLNYLSNLKIKEDMQLNNITNLIQHPIELRPQNLGNENVAAPIYLTKQEQKKIRRNKRSEILLEEQEKIKLGLIEPPPPKVKMSNLMSVLTDDAIQDPTKMEKFVKEQARLRLLKHQTENERKKLSKKERSLKKLQKLEKESKQSSINVAIFAFKHLKDRSWCFKIEQNAIQMMLTGICGVTEHCAVLVVEGAPRLIRKYKHLIQDRIDFDGYKSNSKSFVDSQKENLPQKKNCNFIWEGIVTRRAFDTFSFVPFHSEMAAREVFRKASVEHYWDQSLST
ncbi:MAG: U4/U6 small nuclear ribonucleoprotein Prp3, partial [Paramarteilia canceri]